MIAVTLLVMCIAFVELFHRLRLHRHFDATRQLSQESLAVVRSSTMSDDDKEQAMQRNSLALLAQTGLFVGKLLLILAVLGAVYLAATRLAGVATELLDARLLSPLVWLAMTVVAALYVWIRHAVTRRL